MYPLDVHVGQDNRFKFNQISITDCSNGQGK